MMSTYGRRVRMFLSSLALGIAFAMPTACRAADDFITRLNKEYESVQADKSADRILFPLLVKMTPPPSSIPDVRSAAMISADNPDWAKIKEWAEGETQKAVLEAMTKVTSEENFKKSFEFSQPYGADAAERIDPQLVIDKMYTELGEPALLAQADFLYLPRMNWLQILAHVEATRLVEDAKPADAMDRLVRLCWIGRMMANRQMQTEQTWGLTCMQLALMRLRDVAYLDSRRDDPRLIAEDLRGIIRRLAPEGYIGLGRIEPPRGNRIAADQLVAQVMVAGQGPDESRWSLFLSRIISRNRPLRMFSEAAKWEAIRPLHANTADTLKMIQRVYGDFAIRWTLDSYDPKLKTQSDYSKLDRARFALVDAMVVDMEFLTTIRAILAVEAAGTRMSLGAYGFRLLNRQNPPSLAAARPAIISRTDIDPYDPSRSKFYGYKKVDAGATIDLVVFPEILGVRGTQFGLVVREGQFIVYSAGPDGNDNGGRRATQTVVDEKGDYLIWPPVISIYRQNLSDTASR